ncbi:hypothetical protein HHX47_DHR2000326 [Lentinula edodes]|nr:hypothetical protein HHX47_DHR2000326 [Lentinula edodes]
MVPNHINRPAYAIRDSSGREAAQDDAEDVDGKFPLGGEAERKLRSVASLARTVREYAGSLAKDLPGRLLCGITNNALEAGIAACGPGQPFKNIARAIHTIIEPQYHGMDFCVSPAFSGHGIGSAFHRQPWVLHHCKPYCLRRLLSSKETIPPVGYSLMDGQLARR